MGATEISSGITTFQEGSSNTTHYHNAEESVIVRRGVRLHVGDANLLYYYRNRLEGYGLLGGPARARIERPA